MSLMPKVDVVGVGLNATDTRIALAQYPVCGSKVEYREETVLLGGQVASAVMACQKWGLSTRYVGKIGDDDAARMHAHAFAAAGVEAHLVTVDQAASPRSLILVDSTGERTVLCRRDERLVLRPEELQREWIVSARLLHVDGHDTAAASLAAEWAREVGIPVLADLDEIYPGVESLLRNVDYLIVSRDFPCRLVGESDLGLALRAMQLEYGCKLSAATLGPEGVLAWDGSAFQHSAAFHVPVVDTTGAGDIFHAGFAYGILQGWELDRQLEFSCAAAAMNCMAEGARGGIHTVSAIEDFMATAERRPSPMDIGLRTA